MALVKMNAGSGGGITCASVLKQGSELSTSNFVDIATLAMPIKYVVAYCLMPNYNNFLAVYYADVENDTLVNTYRDSSSGGFEIDISSGLSNYFQFPNNGKTVQFKAPNQYWLNKLRFVISA